MAKKKKYDFVLDTDWLFNGLLDAEQKQYVLLDFFQKLNKHFEELKVYPMFIELSLHLGNIKSLISKNKILYTEKRFQSPDDELLLVDLKMKDLPVLTDEEVVEYKTIIKYYEHQVQEYFDFAKSLWTIAYDSINIDYVNYDSNLDSKSGFLYYNEEGFINVWRYQRKKVYKVKDQERTQITKVYRGPSNGLTIQEILSNFSKTYYTKKESNMPIFEITTDTQFPIDETLLPITKRKILAYIGGENTLSEKKNELVNV
jgi:hypothetical protein